MIMSANGRGSAEGLLGASLVGRVITIKGWYAEVAL
jgi:hypothetical protein